MQFSIFQHFHNNILLHWKHAALWLEACCLTYSLQLDLKNSALLDDFCIAWWFLHDFKHAALVSVATYDLSNRNAVIVLTCMPHTYYCCTHSICVSCILLFVCTDDTSYHCMYKVCWSFRIWITVLLTSVTVLKCITVDQCKQISICVHTNSVCFPCIWTKFNASDVWLVYIVVCKEC